MIKKNEQSEGVDKKPKTTVQPPVSKVIDQVTEDILSSSSKTLETQEIPSAQVFVEQLFNKEEISATFEESNRKLEVKLIDDQTLKITEDGEKIEFTLPISVVEQYIPEETGNPWSVKVKEGWAYTWGDKSSQEAYQQGREELLTKDSLYSEFHDGLPERIKKVNLAVESGYLANFCNGTHFRTTEEAKKRAEQIAETAKELDTPKLDSIHGNLTPRELHLLQKSVYILNIQPYGWDEENGPNTDDWLYSAGFTNDVDSLKWAVENLPKSQKEYDAIINGWGKSEKEADRLKKKVAQSILSRMKD